MKELVVAGFPSEHVALLARVTLARQQAELRLSSTDIAVISRENSGELTSLEAIRLAANLPDMGSALKILARMLFPEDDSGNGKQNADLDRLNSIGIDSKSAQRIANAVPRGAAALMVIANEKSHTQVAAILSAMNGKVTRAHLHCDDCEAELAAVLQPLLE